MDLNEKSINKHLKRLVLILGSKNFFFWPFVCNRMTCKNCEASCWIRGYFLQGDQTNMSCALVLQTNPRQSLGCQAYLGCVLRESNWNIMTLKMQKSKKTRFFFVQKNFQLISITHYLVLTIFFSAHDYNRVRFSKNLSNESLKIIFSEADCFLLLDLLALTALPSLWTALWSD